MDDFGGMLNEAEHAEIFAIVATKYKEIFDEMGFDDDDQDAWDRQVSEMDGLPL